jgi:hypothetical protein
MRIPMQVPSSIRTLGASRAASQRHDGGRITPSATTKVSPGILFLNDGDWPKCQYGILWKVLYDLLP